MECILEVEKHRTRKNAVWHRMVTVESNGARHVLTQWSEATPAAARKIAKREGIRIVEVESE